jgi:hypothetical protein
MARRKAEDIPALVFAVVARIHELTGHHALPWYVDRADLDIDNAGEGVTSAIYFAEVSGWLVGSGEPFRGVSITDAGIKLLEERGLI